MTVLDRIIAEKHREVERLKNGVDEENLRRQALSAEPCRDFVQALKVSSVTPIIAEIKRKSPSKGLLRTIHDVPQFARAYEDAGAAALSVLTDGPYFGGALEDLQSARDAVSIPVLRKDFIVDRVQLAQSRLKGADAILLIVAALDRSVLRNLFVETKDLGMTPLVEVHDEVELAVALSLDPDIVGINNRDLKTLETSIETSVRMARMVPKEIVVIGESGIKGRSDIEYLQAHGVHAFLIGTTLVEADDPAETLQMLCATGEA